MIDSNLIKDFCNHKNIDIKNKTIHDYKIQTNGKIKISLKPYVQDSYIDKYMSDVEYIDLIELLTFVYDVILSKD